MDGIYSVTFRGAVDWGIGMLVLRKGVVTGADAGGIYYDGHYRDLEMSRLLLKFVQQALLVEQATQPWPSVQGRG